MKKQLFWSEKIDETRVFTKEHLWEEMAERNIDELKVYKCKREKLNGPFFCMAVMEFDDKENGNCGKHCSDYEPRNGKSGCCKNFHPYTNMPTDDFIILKLTPNPEDTK